jgi:hypothetical protein
MSNHFKPNDRWSKSQYLTTMAELQSEDRICCVPYAVRCVLYAVWCTQLKAVLSFVVWVSLSPGSEIEKISRFRISGILLKQIIKHFLYISVICDDCASFPQCAWWQERYLTRFKCMCDGETITCLKVSGMNHIKLHCVRLVLYYKGKAIPLQAWTGPEGSRGLRFPDFQEVDKWRW